MMGGTSLTGYYDVLTGYYDVHFSFFFLFTDHFFLLTGYYDVHFSFKYGGHFKVTIAVTARHKASEAAPRIIQCRLDSRR